MDNKIVYSLFIEAGSKVNRPKMETIFNDNLIKEKDINMNKILIDKMSYENNIMEQLLTLFKHSKKEIIFSMYNLFSKDIKESLIEAKKRDVNIFGILNNDKIGRNRKTQQELEKFDIKIKLQENMHQKKFLIDECILGTGSCNWTDTAFKNNIEDLSVLISLEQGIIFKKSFEDRYNNMK